jgi:hypothetical protein
MSGIVIRNRSKALIKKFTVENVKQLGIIVSDCLDVSISMSFILNCAEAALSCSNHSEVHVDRVSGSGRRGSASTYSLGDLSMPRTQRSQA